MFTACGDDNSSSAESNNFSETGKSSASTNASDDYDECYNNTGKLSDKYCCTNFNLLCKDTPASASNPSNSSASNSTLVNDVDPTVSEIWNGKMEIPSTKPVDGVNYMIISTAEELAYFADQVTNKGNSKLNARLVKHIRLNPDNMVDKDGNLLLPASSFNE